MRYTDEDLLQVECIKECDRRGWLRFHCKNEGKKGWGTAAKDKQMGVLSGVADIIVPTKLLAVELKVGRNQLTENQKRFLGACQGAGWQIGVARTLEQFVYLCDLAEAQYRRLYPYILMCDSEGSCL